MTAGCQAFLFFSYFSDLIPIFPIFFRFENFLKNIFSLNSFFSYFSALISIFPIFFQILSKVWVWPVCKSALCQGHGLSALNLPSCRSRVQGPNELGGVLLGEGGGGDSLQHSGFVPQCRVFKKV